LQNSKQKKQTINKHNNQMEADQQAGVSLYDEARHKEGRFVVEQFYNNLPAQ